MYDSLEELASLSKDLQEGNVMLPRAHTLVRRQIFVFFFNGRLSRDTLQGSKICCEGGHMKQKTSSKLLLLTTGSLMI